LISRKIGCRISDSTFWWKYMLLNMCHFLLIRIVYLILRSVPFFSDVGKVAYILVAHPILFELFLTVQRLLVRSLHEHHESAAWVLMSSLLVVKCLTGRFLASLIRSSSLVFLAALHIPFVSEDWRDRQVYRAIHRCSGSRGSFNDPTKHWRNMSFRERYLQAEVLFKLMFTPTTGFLIWWLNISLDGTNPPDGADIITNAVVQWLGVLISHFVDALYTEVIMRRPILITVHRNFRGYHLYLAYVCFEQLAALVCLWAAPFLGRIPQANHTSGGEPTWLFLTDEVVAAMNVSAVCAEFPSAAAFTEHYGC